MYSDFGDNTPTCEIGVHYLCPSKKTREIEESNANSALLSYAGTLSVPVILRARSTRCVPEDRRNDTRWRQPTCARLVLKASKILDLPQ